MKLKAIRDGFGEGLLKAGRNKKVVLLTADLLESTRGNLFAEKYPNRVFDVGIAEQNMMSMASGMAHLGKIPFVNSFAVFNPGRNWDQLRVSVCYSNANVKIHGSHAGLTVGPDGATHQALEDIAITRVLPNLVVIVPADAIEAKNAVIAISKYKGPVYIRTSREKVPIITKDEEFVIGKAKIIKKGTDVTVVACGVEVNEAIKAEKELQQRGISCEIINVPTIKPLDIKTILKSIKKTKALVIAEEHQKAGGLGSAISEKLFGKIQIPFEHVAVNDSFGESGNAKELLKKYKLDFKAIKSSCIKVIKQKN